MSIELLDDDIELWRDEFSTEPWTIISNTDIRNSCQFPIRISYEYVDMGKSQYGFNQSFTSKDSHKYFSYMKLRLSRLGTSKLDANIHSTFLVGKSWYTQNYI